MDLIIGGIFAIGAVIAMWHSEGTRHEGWIRFIATMYAAAYGAYIGATYL